MYKCKECGTEYKEKPDYCDCGNDEFEEIKEIIAEIKPTEKESQIQQELPKKQKPQPASSLTNNSVETNTYNTYSAQPRNSIYIDPISLSIFCICIILSLYVIFFAWNVSPEEQTANKNNTTQINTVTNIPSIEKIWNNTLPTVSNIKQQDIKVNKETNIPKPKTNNTVPATTVKKQQPQKTIITNTKTINTPKKTTQSTKQVNNTKQNNNQKLLAEQAKKEAEMAAKKQAEKEKAIKAAEEAQLKKLQAEQAKKAEAEKQKKAAAAKEEYKNYKAKLRNTIGQKIDFTKVIGDGSCTVTFKIDSNGKLINRSFSKQSTNNTLNDAVYAAIMSTPTFNPPPVGYNNEFLSLNIKFINGNFEISLY